MQGIAGAMMFQFFPNPPSPLPVDASIWRVLCKRPDAQAMMNRVSSIKEEYVMGKGPMPIPGKNISVTGDLVDSLKFSGNFIANDPSIGQWGIVGKLTVDGKDFDLIVTLGDLIDRETAPQRFGNDHVNTDHGNHGPLRLMWQFVYGIAPGTADTQVIEDVSLCWAN